MDATAIRTEGGSLCFGRGRQHRDAGRARRGARYLLWAIDNMMDRLNYEVVNGVKMPFLKKNGERECKVGYEATDKAAVNYGFHAADGSALQPAARCHAKKQIDYSQLLIAVAGWCEFREDGGIWGIGAINGLFGFSLELT